MKSLNALLDFLRDQVRRLMRLVAIALNVVSGGRLTPNTVTIAGLLAHMPIAWLIATGHPLWSAALLVVFGLFDALDGALARLQGRTSTGGMLLDASTDRMKETILYTGIAYFFVAHNQSYYAVWAAAAVGASICVSYVKAKGETAIAKSPHLSVSEINRLFQDGFLRFELRMSLLIIGLLSGTLHFFVPAIAILASITAIERLVRIMKHLDVQD